MEVGVDRLEPVGEVEIGKASHGWDEDDAEEEVRGVEPEEDKEDEELRLRELVKDVAGMDDACDGA